MCEACGCSAPLKKLSRVETIKMTSCGLRGGISRELDDPNPHFTGESAQLLKFHGIYQQDDRDRRRQVRFLGLDKHHMMMIRTRVPGGIVSADAYLAHDRIAEHWGNATLRITTRQDFQLHGVLKGDLKRAIKEIDLALLTTLGGCGDVERNIMCCPAPIKDRFRTELLAALATLVRELTPATRAYHEIWIDGVVRSSSEPEVEPLYGQSYLPRKFKTTVGLENDNCVDVYANDLGLVACQSTSHGLDGFNILVGGGLGRTNNMPSTFVALGSPIGYAPKSRVCAVVKAVVGVERDHGNRADRRYARLKYLIADRGLDWFRSEVQERLGFELEPARRLGRAQIHDHLGWHEQGDGLLYCGIHLESGRIADTARAAVRTGLHRLVTELRPQLRLTPQQNLILADIDPQDQARVQQLLDEHGISCPEKLPPVFRHAMACPALPSCGLALAESERVLPDLLESLSQVTDQLGLGRERISIRMTGCPNGCARPYLGDVGLVGTTLGKYDIFLGGDFEGTRLNQLFASSVPLEVIPSLLRPVLAAFRDHREPGQSFGDWCHQVGVDQLANRPMAMPNAVQVRS